MVYKYTVKKEKEFEIELSNTTLCNAFGRFEFCSRLLYKLKPNDDGVWSEVEQPRINAYIVGFPPYITWQRKEKNIFKATSTKVLDEAYFTELKSAIKGINGIKESEFTKTEYSFIIHNINENKDYKYSFLNRSRAVVAFCVLWDGKDHPRDHLEVNKSNKIPIYTALKQGDNEKITKTYGDPSKTVDELRNEGFPRETDQSERGTYIAITRKDRYETKQEHYQLIIKEQSLLDRVGRSQIPTKYKKELYSESNYRCCNCGEQFPENYLAPDHRVPSIVQADNLTKLNFKEVLQTLCVRCNQVKRESCKKCPHEHKCENCAWAYPEKHGVSSENIKRLQAIALAQDKTINDVLDDLIEA